MWVSAGNQSKLVSAVTVQQIIAFSTSPFMVSNYACINISTTHCRNFSLAAVMKCQSAAMPYLTAR
jgi:hypothetical protein